MADPTARALRLLSLLQAKPYWRGDELADRLAVTTRTVRRDVDRLRGLGYPVDARPGETGGYQLGSGGAALPPLLLDDDEATAVAVALGVTTGGGSVRGIEGPALAALAKLDRLLPPRLRSRVRALRGATVSLYAASPGATGASPDAADADVLVALAQACDGHERLALTYHDRDGHETERRCEPYRLVATGRRWYLLAFDLDRHDWRTFRVDRVSAALRTGHRFVPVDPPDAAAVVGDAITTAPYTYQAVIAFPLPAAELSRKVPPTVGVVRPGGRGEHGPTSVLTVGADDLDRLAGNVIAMGLDFEVLEPAELRDHVRRLGGRLSRRHTGTTGRRG